MPKNFYIFIYWLLLDLILKVYILIKLQPIHFEIGLFNTLMIRIDASVNIGMLISYA